MYVLVSGLPGSGKSTLAPPLARALEQPLLSKDAIKEALWDALGPGDRGWSKRLGTAAAAALESLARTAGGGVIDHFVHTDRLGVWSAFPGIVEVRCACAPEVARARYAARRRHPCHFDADHVNDTYDLWIADEAARPAVGPRLDVNTAAPADIATIARWVHAQDAR